MNDLELCEVYGWTIEELGDTPEWWVARAKLWVGVRSKWRSEKLKSGRPDGP